MLCSLRHPGVVVGYIPLVLERVVILEVIGIPNLLIGLLRAQNSIILLPLHPIVNILFIPPPPPIMHLPRRRLPHRLLLPQHQPLLFPPHQFRFAIIRIAPKVLPRN